MKRIFLIGYMGAGKTTVGKVLSQQLGLSFIDLDHYIEGRYHKTVGQLFAERGEEAFRDIERRMLREVAAFENVLVSTGGGAPCFFDNIEFMNEAGQTVYLKVSVEELAKRLELCKSTRPILKGRSGDELKASSPKAWRKGTFLFESGDCVQAEEMMTDQDVHKISQELATRL